MLMRVNLIRFVCVCASRELNIFGTRPIAYRSSHHFCVCGFYFICFLFPQHFNSRKRLSTSGQIYWYLRRFYGCWKYNSPGVSAPPPSPQKSTHQKGKTGKIPMHPGGVVEPFYITPFSLDLRRWEPAMTPNESPPTRTGVPVHLDTGPSSI